MTQTSDEEQTAAIHLGAREVPWPSAMSPEGRERLRLLVDNRANETPIPEPDPSDHEAWRAYVAKINTKLLTTTPPIDEVEVPGVQTESRTVGGARTFVATPETVRPGWEQKVYLDIHGGGMVFLEGEGTRRNAAREAARWEVLVVSVDYRVPPDHPYPAAVDDCLSTYRALLDTYAPHDIIVGGGSGGGNLAAASMLRARDEGLPLPAGVILFTPEADLTESGDSFDTIQGLDPVLAGRLTRQITAYAGGADLTHPYLSPLFADYAPGFPPTFLQSGTRDLFLSNTVRLHRVMREALVQAELHIWDGLPHGGFVGTPEGDAVTRETLRFIERCWA
jgi:monoterpene epsilon-lactone hydrolase